MRTPPARRADRRGDRGRVLLRCAPGRARPSAARPGPSPPPDAGVRCSAPHSALRDAAFRPPPTPTKVLRPNRPSGGTRPMDRGTRRRRGWGQLGLAALLGMALLIGGAVVAYAKGGGGTAKPPAGAAGPLVPPPPPHPAVPTGPARHPRLRRDPL